MIVGEQLLIKIETIFEQYQVRQFKFDCLMRRQMQRRLNKVFPADTPPTSEPDNKLTHIINTFRQNHLKLIHKIEECDKMRQYQHHRSTKKFSQQLTFDKHIEKQDHHIQRHESILRRPYSNLKTTRDQIQRDPSRKQNLCIDKLQGSREDCEEALISHNEDFRFVRVKVNKLVPLSMDRLKERLKLL